MDNYNRVSAGSCNCISMEWLNLHVGGGINLGV